MKTCRKLAALVAALTLTMVPLAGCGGGGTESSGTTGSAAGADKEALIKSEPSSISFLALDYDESKTDSAYNLAIAKFKEVYGKDVKIIQAGADQKVMDKVAANIAAKDPIDVFVMITEQYLNMIHQNYLLPVDDYVTVPAEGNDRTVMDSFLKFDGKYYGYGGGINPYVLCLQQGPSGRQRLQRGLSEGAVRSGQLDLGHLPGAGPCLHRRGFRHHGP